jgi:hypothetical protein
MVYSIYTWSETEDTEEFSYVREQSLFGCNAGIVPKLVEHQFSKKGIPSDKWQLKVREALAQIGSPGETLMIDLKPKNNQPNVSLYELRTIWGDSDEGWSVLMLHLRGLAIDKTPEDLDKHQFRMRKSEIDDPIFTTLYVNGGFKDGKLTGRWTPPPVSSTNGALIWPETWSFFVKSAGKVPW